MNHIYRILSYTKKYWKQLIISVVAATLFGISSGLPTLLLKQTVDDIFIKQHGSIVIPLLGLFLLFFILKATFMFLASFYMFWIGNKVVNDLRSDLFGKIINLPLAQLQQRTTGQLMSHFLNDIAMIQQSLNSVIKDGIRSFFEAIILLGIALYQNWMLGGLMFLFAPIFGYSIRQLGRRRKEASLAIQKNLGVISSSLQETFVGIRELKAFNAEAVEHEQFGKRLDKFFKSTIKNARIESLAPAIAEIIAASGVCLIAWVAVNQVINGTITAGQLTSFIAAVFLTYQPIKKMTNVYSDIQYGLAAADRVFTLMDTKAPVTENRTVEIKTFDTAIAFDQVWFSYDGKENVFEDTSLVIGKGESIGLLGPSGSGKSTFCDLLLGFISPTTGTMLIDGIDMTKISYTSLRNHIGYVGQRTFLFNESIFYNIAYAFPHASREQVIKACRAANADEFIERLPQGYNTVVGENGIFLSGGQKQRLTIARALLRNPEILIFDEATSSLDPISELAIRQAIKQLSTNKTVIIVSHRYSMFEGVDRMLTIQNKRIEQGPHHLSEWRNEAFVGDRSA